MTSPNIKMKIHRTTHLSHEEAIAILLANYPTAAWYINIPGKICHQFRGVPGSATRGWDYLVSAQVGARFASYQALDHTTITVDGITIERFRSVFALVIVEGNKRPYRPHPLIADYYKRTGLPFEPLDQFLALKPRWIHLVGKIPAAGPTPSAKKKKSK